MWFAWKFVPLWYQQQQIGFNAFCNWCCDLLENSYLCGISNNITMTRSVIFKVVICLKIRTFVVSATTGERNSSIQGWLWFAWKFVPLWYQQQLILFVLASILCCDLLENSYLCGISNNEVTIFHQHQHVVICLKIRTFVVSATTQYYYSPKEYMLWFAWKFVPLWYQQQRETLNLCTRISCDLLENSYLCGISNNTRAKSLTSAIVVICLKIRTFVVSATTIVVELLSTSSLWFAWKFVPLWYQQQRYLVK